jgi:hypothetical protein
VQFRHGLGGEAPSVAVSKTTRNPAAGAAAAGRANALQVPLRLHASSSSLQPRRRFSAATSWRHRRGRSTGRAASCPSRRKSKTMTFPSASRAWCFFMVASPYVSFSLA